MRITHQNKVTHQIPSLKTVHRTVFFTLADQPTDIYRGNKRKKRATKWLLVFFGSPNWARTSDIMINSHALYRLSYGGIYKCWRLPIFTGRFQPTIFGTTELNFCVRDGNRWTLSVINTNYLFTSIHFLGLGDPCENRTRVAAVRGRSLNRLTNGPILFG